MRPQPRFLGIHQASSGAVGEHHFTHNPHVEAVERPYVFGVDEGAAEGSESSPVELEAVELEAVELEAVEPEAVELPVEVQGAQESLTVVETKKSRKKKDQLSDDVVN